MLPYTRRRRSVVVVGSGMMMLARLKTAVRPHNRHANDRLRASWRVWPHVAILGAWRRGFAS